MSEMVIRGSLESLREQALAIREVVSRRASEGWLIFQADEEWTFRTEGDSRVCPYCKAYEEDNPWRGNEIPQSFPRLFYEGSGANLIVRPNVHESPGLRFLRGPCRCTLRMINVAETMERRLHKEKMRVVI